MRITYLDEKIFQKHWNENIYKYIFEPLYSITQGAQRILVSSWPDSVNSKTSSFVVVCSGVV